MAKTIAQGRRPKRVNYGENVRQIFLKFIRPFLNVLTLKEGESDLSHGIRKFFSIDYVDVYVCRALIGFVINAPSWHADGPHSLVHYVQNRGRGKRRVCIGDTVVVREDERTPDTVEMEFNDRVFVLTAADWEAVKDNLEVIC